MRWLPWLLMLTCAASAHAQKRHRIDLTQYGFKPTQNREYIPREFLNEIEFLPDGSLVVAFRSPSLVSEAVPKSVRNLQPTEMLRLDADSGKLLATTRRFVSRGLPYLSPSPVGVMVVEGGVLVEYSPDLKVERRFTLTPNIGGLALVPERDAMVVYEKSVDLQQRVQVLNMSTQSVEDTYTLQHGTRIAPLKGGFVMTAHDAKGNRVARIYTALGTKDIILPMLPCLTHIATVSSTAAVAMTCSEWILFDVSGNVLSKHRFSSDEDSPYVFAGKGRFAISTYLGFAGYPRDEQREHAKAMRVAVFDLATGGKLFSTDVNPLPKLGGSCALSRDGKRLAILEDGFVEVIDLE